MQIYLKQCMQVANLFQKMYKKYMVEDSAYMNWQQSNHNVLITEKKD